jgi:hypothetical protein
MGCEHQIDGLITSRQSRVNLIQICERRYNNACGKELPEGKNNFYM